MRERVRQLLNLLAQAETFIPTPELARQIGAGVRTTFRDIQELERYLAGYDIQIEKKRSAGIRLVGDTAILPKIEAAPPFRLADMTMRRRQEAILVYLALHPRVIKLNELALLFFVSDSCVSNDLKDLESRLEQDTPGARLMRLKGVGAQLAGDEWDIRIAALGAASALIPPREFIRYLATGEEEGEFSRIIRLLGIPANKARIMEAIHGAENRIGYRFSWYDFGLLLLYLVIAVQRVGIGTPRPGAVFYETEMCVPFAVARQLWTTLTDEKETEIFWLQGILSALEPGEIRETRRYHPRTPKIVSMLVAELEKQGKNLYDFDSRLFFTLQANLSSLAYKKLFGLPVRDSPSPSGEEDQALREDLLNILQPLFQRQFGVSLEPRDIESTLTALRAADAAFHGTRPTPRILVTCFEGICLAQFIASTLKTTFPDVTVVDVLSCDRISDEYLKEKRIDLVLTTFPIGLTAAPEHVLSTPLEVRRLRRELDEVLSGYTGGAKREYQEKDSKEAPEIDTAISILQKFRLTFLPGPVPEALLTTYISQEILEKSAGGKQLKADLDHREAFGPVVLEQAGIRLFHCRSRAVKEPIAGILRVENNPESIPAPGISTFLYMVAPDPASRDVINALSIISVALIEDPDFALSLVRSGEEEIKRRLFAFLAATI